MKRLWMRLGLLAGILATGGAGILVAQRGSGEPSEEEVAAGPEEQQPPTTPRPIAFSPNGADDNELTPPPVLRAEGTESDYSNPLPIRTVSDESDADAPPARPTTASIGDGSDYGGGDQYQYQATDEGVESPSPRANEGYAQPYTETEDATPLPIPGEFNTGSDSATPYVGETDSGAGGYVGEMQQIPSRPTAGNESTALDSYTDAGGGSQAGSLLSPPELAREAATTALSNGATVTEVAIDDGAAGMPEVADSAVNPMREAASQTQHWPQTASAASSSIAGNAAVVAAPIAAALALDTPGDRELEGVQTPTLTLEKRAPAEVSVGQEATFEITVRNVGDVIARGVVVTDRIPQGTRFVDASPEFSQTSDQALAWQLGDIDPGDRSTITLKLMPTEEGEIGSVAQLSFQAQASVRTVSTKPGLIIKHSGPEKVLVGENVVFNIVLSNPGTGVATGVVIEEDVPEGLAHLAGNALEYEVGTLRPGEEKPLQLILKADKAGIVKNLLRASGDAGLEASHESTLEVIAPALQLAIGGPKMRYLEREVTYEIAMANPGTATAYDVELVTTLPRGLKFVSADSKGSYDARNHVVYWSLAELPAQESGSVKLTAVAIESGEQKLRIEGTGKLGVAAEAEHTTTVEGLSELAFSVEHKEGPIEVDKETTYEIRIVNKGNKTATNIQVAAGFPAELSPLRGAGHTKVIVEGQQVFMNAIEKLAPRKEAVYRVVAKGLQPGDHIMAVQLVSDDAPTPVTKQVGTKVYTDR